MIKLNCSICGVEENFLTEKEAFLMGWSFSKQNKNKHPHSWLCEKCDFILDQEYHANLVSVEHDIGAD